MVRKLVVCLVGLAVMLAITLVLVTWQSGSRQLQVVPVQPVAVDALAAAGRLAAAVRLRTESSETDPQANADEFRKLHALLASQYPAAHAAMKREVIGEFGLLYTWPGRNPALPGVLLMAHQDVVPVAPGTEKDWVEPPFSGAIRDGFVWGRGAWDDKGALMALMESVQMLASGGFVPDRTVYLAFGHDEEVLGLRGAARIAQALTQRGVTLSLVLDEGMLITEGMLKGIDLPVAIVGVAEKGYLTLTLTATGRPGHSSMPPDRTAIGALARAITRIEAHPMPARISGVSRAMFDTIAPEMSGINRLMLTNLWLLEPLVRSQLQKAPSTNALLRTTTAPTMLEAGNKENVLPGQAQATINFRLLPGDRIDDVIAHVRRVVDDADVTVAARPGATEATRVTPGDSAGYRLLAGTLRELSPAIVVTPGLMVGGTDSRHFDKLAQSVFKFRPVRAGPDDLARFHGTNERMSIANHVQIIQFYHRLISNLEALR